ncbi:MAG: hypothetical protein KDA78_13040 [Planctomycetaceae bacterium]|nr:hypothetical protein [Planctomycetaceae bacterium]
MTANAQSSPSINRKMIGMEKIQQNDPKHSLFLSKKTADQTDLQYMHCVALTHIDTVFVQTGENSQDLSQVSDLTIVGIMHRR